MSDGSKRRRGGLKCRPTISAMEGRVLLTAAPSTLTRLQSSALFTSVNGVTGIPDGGIGGTALSTGSDPGVIASGYGVPTAHEQVRNRFFGHFGGDYSVAPGRTDQQSRTLRWSAAGTWTDILHGMTLSAISIPAVGSPDQSNRGIVELNPKSIGVTGQLLLRVTAQNGDMTKPGPTTLDWVVDPSSSGAYTNATGQGTIRVKYGPPSSHNGRVVSGKVMVFIGGTLIRTGLPY